MNDGDGADDLWKNTAPQPASGAEPAATTPPQPTDPTPDPTQVMPVTPAGQPPRGPQPGAGAGSPGGADDGSSSGRPAWLIPAAAGLAVGLVIALGALLLLRGGDDTSDVATSTIPAVSTAADTSPAVEPTPETTVEPAPDTTLEPATETTVEPAPETTEAPAPETTAEPAPDTTEAPAPETTAEPAPGIAPASDGFARIGGSEWAIRRTCFTAPLAPNNGDLQVTSYLIDSPNGSFDVVERWFDEGGVSGANFTETFGLIDTEGLEEVGDDGFGFFLAQGDTRTEVSVNPPTGGAEECLGSAIVNDPATPNATYTHTVLDICFGDQSGTLQYIAILSEGGKINAAPNAGGDLTLTFSDFAVFQAVDPAATTVDFDEGIEFRATPIDNGEPIAVVMSVRGDLIRDCTASDF